MAKKQRRRSISVTERHYVLLQKLAKARAASCSATVEHALDLLAAQHGIEVSDVDILEYRTRPKVVIEQPTEPEAKPASRIFTF